MTKLTCAGAPAQPAQRWRTTGELGSRWGMHRGGHQPSDRRTRREGERPARAAAQNGSREPAQRWAQDRAPQAAATAHPHPAPASSSRSRRTITDGPKRRPPSRTQRASARRGTGPLDGGVQGACDAVRPVPASPWRRVLFCAEGPERRPADHDRVTLVAHRRSPERCGKTAAQATAAEHATACARGKALGQLLTFFP
jgi:hypothetical protein